MRGLALNPGTPLEWLAAPLLEEVDMISLLAIDPGWSGQKFAPTTFDRHRAGEGADRGLRAATS